MKRFTARFACCLFAAVASAPYLVHAQNAPGTDTESPRLVFTAPYAAVKVGDSFQVDLEIKPAVSKSVHVTFQNDPKFNVAQSEVDIQPGQVHSVSVKAMSSGADGLPWLRANTAGYGLAETPINLGFLGHLSTATIGRLPYEDSTNIMLLLVDKDGKPFSTDKVLEVSIRSTDAFLQMGDQKGDLLKVPLLRNANVTQPFQIKPLNRLGRDVHLSTTLTTDAIPDFSLDTQYFSLTTFPAWWLPILLALGGGLLYGAYKALNLPPRPEKNSRRIAAVLATSAMAGLLGYLIANLDLLGLKLDPNSLRSYPLLGFLVAYIGVEPLVGKFVPKKPADTTAA